MTIKLTDKASMRTRRRVKRHGYEYDIVLEHFIDSKPAPFGLLVKSRRTSRYTWFDRRTIMCIEDKPSSRLPVPELMEGMKTYTPNKQMIYEYLDHLMDNVLSKRDQKRFGPIYDRVKDDQISLVHRINSL